jgi:hypothetical protein
MKIFVDIDETICTNDVDRNYSNALPITENIKKINKLYDDGYEITYWSARGSGTGINWYNITYKQFDDWGVKYHHLNLGEKPIFDLLIDDKAVNIKGIDFDKLCNL